MTDFEDDEPTLTRRGVVAGGASLSLTVIGCGKGKRWEASQVPAEEGVVSLAISDHPPLAKAGGMVAVQPPGARKPLLVMRIENDHFRVMSLKCPHLGCTVRWDSEQQNLVCPCHGSRFDDGGKVLEGPAKASLKQYQASFVEMQVRFKVDDDA